MKIKSIILLLGILICIPAQAQTIEVKLSEAQPKITMVSAMRARRNPVVSGEEIMRLKLGTVVSATGRSADQDTVAGKTDYWYRVNLPNGESGWVFGGLREELVKQIIEDRLKAEKTEFTDRQEIYNLAASSVTEAKDATRTRLRRNRMNQPAQAIGKQHVDFAGFDDCGYLTFAEVWMNHRLASAIGAGAIVRGPGFR